MQAVVKNGFLDTDRLVPIVLAALEQAIGKNGLRTLVNSIDRPRLLDPTPVETQSQTFAFSDFSAMFVALDEIYGAKGGRVLAVQVGRSVFTGMLANFVELAGIYRLRQQALATQMKVRIALAMIARCFNETNEQECSVAEGENEFTFTLQHCPVCRERAGLNQPVCFFFIGYLQEALKRVSGGEEFRLRETRCLACGDAVCEFLIQKPIDVKTFEQALIKSASG